MDDLATIVSFNSWPGHLSYVLIAIAAALLFCARPAATQAIPPGVPAPFRRPKRRLRSAGGWKSPYEPKETKSGSAGHLCTVGRDSF